MACPVVPVVLEVQVVHPYQVALVASLVVQVVQAMGRLRVVQEVRPCPEA